VDEFIINDECYFVGGSWCVFCLTTSHYPPTHRNRHIKQRVRSIISITGSTITSLCAQDPEFPTARRGRAAPSLPECWGRTAPLHHRAMGDCLRSVRRMGRADARGGAIGCGCALWYCNPADTTHISNHAKFACSFNYCFLCNSANPLTLLTLLTL
jgi:hypothetical protein